MTQATLVWTLPFAILVLAGFAISAVRADSRHLIDLVLRIAGGLAVGVAIVRQGEVSSPLAICLTLVIPIAVALASFSHWATWAQRWAEARLPTRLLVASWALMLFLSIAAWWMRTAAGTI